MNVLYSEYYSISIDKTYKNTLLFCGYPGYIVHYIHNLFVYSVITHGLCIVFCIFESSKYSLYTVYYV